MQTLSTGVVRIIDHTFVYSLVKGSDGTIAGAVGAGLQHPGDYLFKAKGVIKESRKIPGTPSLRLGSRSRQSGS